MVDVFNCQVELILMMLTRAAVFRAAVGENPEKINVLLLVKRQHFVVEHIGGHERILSVVEFGQGHARVSVDECLLVDLADAFDVADVVRVLRAQITRMMCLGSPVGLLVLLLAFESRYLRVR